jgi:hypothetical protein
MGEFDKYATKGGPDATKQYGNLIEEMGRLV